MRAVLVVFRSELHQRWRSWLALTVLVAFVGGTVLGAVAAGSRTASAFPRFLARYGYDVQAYNFPSPLPAGLPVANVSAIYYEKFYDECEPGHQRPDRARERRLRLSPAVGTDAHDQARGGTHAHSCRRGPRRLCSGAAVQAADRLCRHGPVLLAVTSGRLSERQPGSAWYEGQLSAWSGSRQT